MMSLDIFYPPSSRGGIALGNGASERYLDAMQPGRFSERLEFVVGTARFVVGTDASDRELTIRQSPPGFVVTVTATDGEEPSPMLIVLCPPGPVAVFQVFDLMNGEEESELVAVFDPSVTARIDAVRQAARADLRDAARAELKARGEKVPS